MGVVWQDDLLIPSLTVRETIEFAAKLKTPSYLSSSIPQYVDEVIHDLGLAHIEHSLVGVSGGTPGFHKKTSDISAPKIMKNATSFLKNFVGMKSSAGRGISGGERKRVSVAQELVTKPSLLFLDEPTSGLDATSALSLMKTLHSLAHQSGHSIVVVLHQPRTKIFDLLDGLLLLSRGEEVYSGHPNGARAVLESCPIIGYSLPDQTNVADWIMDVIADDEKRSMEIYRVSLISKDDENSRDTGLILPKHWASIKDKVVIKESITTKNHLTHRLSSLTALQTSVPRYSSTSSYQLRLLTTRSMKQRRGERITSTAFLVSFAYLAFEVIFWFRLPNDTNHVFGRNSILFFLIIALSNGIVTASVATFQQERALLRRERSKKMYRMLPYYTAKTLSDMTVTTLLPMLNVLIAYWLINLRPTAKAFFTFLTIFYLLFSCAQSLGLLLSVAISNMQVALLVAPVLTLLMIVVGGFYIPLNNFPIWIRWIKYTSFATYGYSALLITEYRGRMIPCVNDVSVSIGSGICPLPGEEVYKSIGVTGIISHLWFDFLMLILLQLLFRIGAYTLLRRSR